MDPNYLLDLTDDNRTITKEILLDFVRSDAADRANLAVAHQAGDTKALNMLAHRIKGGARSIGAVVVTRGSGASDDRVARYRLLLAMAGVAAMGAVVVIGVTFLCGLIPVIGNLVSNTVIVGIGFTVSPKMALTALVFLVVIHKLEYFLNSKIIGQRIHNPLWLTLLALVLGEKLMGISGMILAPVVLNYIRMEASRIEVKRQLDPPVSPV